MIEAIFKYTGQKFVTGEIVSGGANSVIDTISPLSFVNKKTIPTVLRL